MLMPASTQRAHFEPPWRGDRPAALVSVGKRARGKDRIRAIDTNWQWAWKDTRDHSRGGNPRNMHWATPGKNAYWFILEPGAKRARPMSRIERNRPIGEWRDADVARWRRTPSPASAHPRTLQEMASIARSHDVYLTPELKSAAFEHDAPCRIAVGQLRAAGHPAWGMALYNRHGGKSIPGCRQKCEAWERAGGEFAVIFGRFQSYRKAFYAEKRRWSPQPSRVW